MFTGLTFYSLYSFQLLKEDRQLFNAADENLDGRLDEKEFLAFTHPEEDPKMLPIILQQTLDEKDTDKDGAINFQEFVGDKGSCLQYILFCFFVVFK